MSTGVHTSPVPKAAVVRAAAVTPAVVPVAATASAAVVLADDPLPQCSGRAAEALEVFRQRERELKLEEKKKPDMIAFKELAREWTPERTYGHIPGVPIGIRLNGRGEAAILGIHRQILRGIDTEGGNACYAVCVSGKYVDDNDKQSDGTIVYTGEGGQDKAGKTQVKDQLEKAPGNAALIKSVDTGDPIRVLRVHEVKKGKLYYTYDGLYTCTGYQYTASIHGPMVYKFTLEPIKEESSKTTSPVTAAAALPTTFVTPSPRIPRKKRPRPEENYVVIDDQARRLARQPIIEYEI